MYRLLILLLCSRREYLIEETVGRNVEMPKGGIDEIDLSEKEKFVVEKLNIKESLIFNAKAILAENQQKYDIENVKINIKFKMYLFNCLVINIFRHLEAVTCYLKAERWQEAHNVLVNHLLADFILYKGNKT